MSVMTEIRLGYLVPSRGRPLTLETSEPFVNIFAMKAASNRRLTYDEAQTLAVKKCRGLGIRMYGAKPSPRGYESDLFNQQFNWGQAFGIVTTSDDDKIELTKVVNLLFYLNLWV